MMQSRGFSPRNSFAPPRKNEKNDPKFFELILIMRIDNQLKHYQCLNKCPGHVTAQKASNKSDNYNLEKMAQ